MVTIAADTLLGPAPVEGTMGTVEVAGETLLLARVDGRCHAVGARCPHAGAPLDQGVLHGRVVTCPWHKAAFRIDTGQPVEPPALDDLPCFPVREQDGTLFAAPAPVLPAVAPAAADRRCFLLVGAGAAGAVAAQTLRREGFQGRIVLIGQEDRLPYDRTIQSKYVLSGQRGGEKSPLQDAAFYDRNRIERLVGRVRAIDIAARRVTLADGRRLDYDAALLATGGVPRPLRISGADLPGAFLLRSAADAAAIVAAAKGARRAAVIGAGFIALEAAASLRERGLEVTVIAPQNVPFERRLGAQVGAAFRAVHERKGVVFRLGEEAVALEGVARVERVRLQDGSSVAADVVVAGLGVAPATAIEGLTPGEDGALSVDASLAVAPGLYAAGDIAAFPYRGDGPPIRVEHWRVAQQHGRVAARAMLGRAARYDAVPYFWTIHFLQRLDYVGHAERWDAVEIDGDLERPAFLAFYVDGGRVAAVAGWDRDRQMAAAIELLTERRDWSVPALREAIARLG